MSADELGAVVLVCGSVLILLAWLAFGRRREHNWDEMAGRIMELPVADQERLEYAIEKLIEHQYRGPTLDELMVQFDKLTDEQQQAELAELRRRVSERKGRGENQ